jgi:hypothetical protein
MAEKFFSIHRSFFKVKMEVFKLLLVLTIVIPRSNGSTIKDSIKTLENLLVNFNSALTVNAFLCWESGNIRFIFYNPYLRFIERFF